MGDYPVKLEVEYEEKASRLEVLLIRWLYLIVLTIVLEVWGIITTIGILAQGIVILITGKRNRGLHGFIEGYYRFHTRVYSYIMLLTDARPPLSGK